MLCVAIINRASATVDDGASACGNGVIAATTEGNLRILST